jgi:hypothetical protein
MASNISLGGGGAVEIHKSWMSRWKTRGKKSNTSNAIDVEFIRVKIRKLTQSTESTWDVLCVFFFLFLFLRFFFWKLYWILGAIGGDIGEPHTLRPAPKNKPQ